MKVLFCGLKYEYGKKEAGLSFEYQNFYQVLSRMMNVQAEMFAMDEVISQVGREEMNLQLIQKVQELKPDLLFCFLFTEELKKETIDFITKNTKTKTFNWFADDHWRFEIYSKHWAPVFTAISTTDSEAVAKYKNMGVNVIKTQWAANLEIYKPVNNQQSSISSDIAFVGKKYGKREAYINSLKQAGLSAKGFGSGWDGGRINQEQMISCFTHSKINLNFTESYFKLTNQLAKLFLKKTFNNYNLNLLHPIANFKSLLGARRKQIKARIFEIPACGGFLLTGAADNLSEYYVEGKEIVTFNNVSDLIEKSKYYLSHESERLEIAQAGYKRTLKDHSYEQRFTQIFKTLELL